MTNNTTESAGLKTIAMEYLYEGMAVFEDIYSYNGELLLVAKDIVLTEQKLQQLKHFNSGSRNISVADKTYRSLIERGLCASSALTQGFVEKEVGYTQAEESVGDLLLDISRTNSISHAETKVIADALSSKFTTTDASLIFQCINAPKPIDEYLRRHSVNVGLINGLIGKWLRLGQEEIDALVVAGIVHDIGKTKIPTAILDVPRKLSLSEYEVMKMHPIYSFDLLNKDALFSDKIKLAARHHHEKMNGSGYPDGINAQELSLFAKITAVSDIYDAMVSARSYKTANNPFAIISQLSNKQFSELDMKLVKIFAEHMPMELVGKSVFLSDGSIGVVRFIIPSDMEYPMVEVNGEVKKTNADFYCERMILEN